MFTFALSRSFCMTERWLIFVVCLMIMRCINSDIVAIDVCVPELSMRKDFCDWKNSVLPVKLYVFYWVSINSGKIYLQASKGAFHTGSQIYCVSVRTFVFRDTNAYKSIVQSWIYEFIRAKSRLKRLSFS